MKANKIPLDDYVPLRKGLLEHVRERKMTLDQYGLFVWLLQLADEKMGAVLNINAKRLAKDTRMPEERVRSNLRRLEQLGYTKPLYWNGHRGWVYHIIINRYYVPGKGFVCVEKCQGNKIAIEPHIEVFEEEPDPEVGRPVPVPILVTPWAKKIAEVYFHIRPCSIAVTAKQIDINYGYDQPEDKQMDYEVIYKCTQNYLRYVKVKNVQPQYRMQARNFFRAYEFLNYQDSVMEEILKDPDDIFDEFINRSKNEKTNNA